MNIALGIDPGGSGYLAVLNADSREFVGSYALSFFPDGQFDAQAASVWLHQVIKDNDGVVTRCCLEEVHAIFGSSAKSTFQFGRTFGALETFLTAVGISFKPVPPKSWQKKLWDGIKPVLKGGKLDTKAVSLSAAKKLFPLVDFRPNGCTDRCKKADDNKVDAVLIAYYSCL